MRGGGEDRVPETRQEGNSECGKRQAVLYDLQGKYNGRTGGGGG